MTDLVKRREVIRRMNPLNRCTVVPSGSDQLLFITHQHTSYYLIITIIYSLFLFCSFFPHILNF